MFGLDDILGGVGDVAGYFAGGSDRQAAMNALENSRKGWEAIDPTIHAQEASSAFPQAGQGSEAQQQDVMSQLRAKYNQGGLDALDRAKLNEINQSIAQTARGAGQAAQQDAARRGMLNSASSLVAEQQAGQNAGVVGANQGVNAAAEAESARRGTLNQAGWMAGQMRGQDYEKAAAQDAINRFNASQRQGAETSTLHGQLARQGGISDVYSQQYGAHNKQADQTRRLYGEIGQTIGSVGNYFAPDGGASAGPEKWMSGDMMGGAIDT